MLKVLFLCTENACRSQMALIEKVKVRRAL